MLDLSREWGNAALGDARYRSMNAKLVALSVVQLGVLFFMIAISVVKPWGRKKAG